MDGYVFDTSEIVFLATCLFFMIAGLMLPKSKILFWVEAILLFILTVLFVKGGDLPLYRLKFENKTYLDTAFEKTFELIGYWMNHHGGHFLSFRIVLAAVAFLLITLFVLYASPAPAFVMSLMFGFVTYEYAWQLQQLTCDAVVLWAIYFYLAFPKNRYREIIYIAMILFAEGFHLSALLWLPVLLLSFMDQKKIPWLIIAGVLGIFFAISFMMPIFMELSPGLQAYQNLLSGKTVFCMIAWQFVTVYFTWSARKYLLYSDISLRERDRNYIDGIFYVSICLMIIIPFYMYATTVNRLVRLFFIFMLIQISFIPKLRLSSERVSRLMAIAYVEVSYVLFFVLFTPVNRLGEYLDGNVFLHPIRVGNWLQWGL